MIRASGRWLLALWMSLGAFLHRTLSPIILGIVFFGMIFPIGVARRLLGLSRINRIDRRGDLAAGRTYRGPPQSGGEFEDPF